MQCGINGESDMSVTIYLNQQAIELIASSSLQRLHSQLNLPAQGCVFSINGHVVPKSEWEQTMLSTGDQISLFQAIAGG